MHVFSLCVYLQTTVCMYLCKYNLLIPIYPSSPCYLSSALCTAAAVSSECRELLPSFWAAFLKCASFIPLWSIHQKYRQMHFSLSSSLEDWEPKSRCYFLINRAHHALHFQKQECLQHLPALLPKRGYNLLICETFSLIWWIIYSLSCSCTWWLCKQSYNTVIYSFFFLFFFSISVKFLLIAQSCQALSCLLHVCMGSSRGGHGANSIWRCSAASEKPSQPSMQDQSQIHTAVCVPEARCAQAQWIRPYMLTPTLFLSKIPVV